MATKRKTTTGIVAGVTAAALLLGGTFAWTSISQQAKNEAIVDINPGGRLHDDFNGTNKDVYVENFSSGATGVDIFARIRLDQYFEVGQDAGINKGEADRKVTQVLGTDINKVETWVTFKPVDEEGKFIDLSDLVQANGNWQWTLGNDTSNMPYYMPTFNMNKDSLAADINGTYEGTVEGDIVHYDDYKEYSADEPKEGTEVYDWDEDTVEEDGDTVDWDNGGITYTDTTPIDSADVYHKSTTTNEDGETVNLTHSAKQINYAATVISMADWLALPAEEQTGAFWVYDTDGWAYWAQPIKPGETTGLLLDGINMSKVPDDNYYYGINVVGQFATAGDWTLLYSTTGSAADAMTDGAKQLMTLITATNSSTEGGEDDNTTQTLVLTPANSHTVYADIDEAINITYDITGYEDDVESTPNISTVTVTYDEFDDSNDGQAVPTPLTADQYTYTYDPDTGTGTLKITDSNLDGYYLTVSDSTGAVSGDIDLSTPSSDPDFYEDGTLNLRTDGADTETLPVGTGITVEFDTSDLDPDAEDYVAPGFENLTLTYTRYESEEDQTGTEVTLTDTQYTYTYDQTTGKGSLTITDETLVGERLYVADKSGILLGDVDVTDKEETSTAVITIDGYEPNDEGYIYLDALTTQENEYTVYVDDSFELQTLVSTMATGVSFKADVANKTAALTISPFAWNTITITATDVNGATETVYVVPIFDAIQVTPSMHGTTLTLGPGPYGLVEEEFTGTDPVVFTIEAIGDDPITRCEVIYNETTQTYTLSVPNAETATSFTLIATQADSNTEVTITINLVNLTPSLEPDFGYIDDNELVGWGLEDGTYVIKLKPGHSYHLTTGVPHTFEGTVTWSVLSATEGEDAANVPAYFDSDTAKKQSDATDPKTQMVEFHIANDATVGDTFVLMAQLTETGAEDSMPGVYYVQVNIVAEGEVIE